MSETIEIVWEKVSSNCESFQLGKEPEVIHVIKTGFRDKYMVVHEDAFETVLGKVDFQSKKEIEDKYKIKLA